ncbi:hypothetical protein KR084_011656, partial [Drosophila pseudotakahashii]
SVFSYPQSSPDEEQMQSDADDFDYGDESQSAPSSQTKSSSPSNGDRVNKTLTLTGIRGEDVLLKCDVGTDLETCEACSVLWYFGDHIIANGKNLVQTNFKLDSNFDLTILKASPQDAGGYLCKVLPAGSLVSTKVIIAEHSLDAIAPESSTSAAGSASSLLGYTLLGSIVLLLLGMGKH